MMRRRIVLIAVPLLSVTALLVASQVPAADPILEGYQGSYPEQSTMVYKTGATLEVISSMKFEPAETELLRSHIETRLAESKGYKWTVHAEYDLTTIRGQGEMITARLNSDPPQISIYRKSSRLELFRLWIRRRGTISAYEVRTTSLGGTSAGPDTMPIWKALFN